MDLYNLCHHPRELSECDCEPIHNIATAQGFGGFVKLKSDWSIAHRSLNVADVLGPTTLPNVGLKLRNLFQPTAIETLKKALVDRENRPELTRVFGLQLTASHATFDCALHTVGDGVTIAFEPHNSFGFAGHTSLIGPILAQLESVTDLPTLCGKAAKLVRQMLGYDRVMIYRFHADETGKVIAEDARKLC